MKTEPEFFCFVLMPFDTNFEDIYKIGIKESCKNADSLCERVDEQIYHGNILERIYNQIAKADLIIAEMTGKNPNVFYEVGYAHALKKKTILLTQNIVDIPFDLKQFPHIEYKEIEQIKDRLTEQIKYFKDDRDYLSLLDNIKIDVDYQDINTNNVVHEYDPNKPPSFTFVVHNISKNSTIRTGFFQISILCDKYLLAETTDIKTVNYSETQHRLYLPYFGTIFPESNTEYFFSFRDSPSVRKYSNFMIKIRLTTNNGHREFLLKLMPKVLNTL